MYAMFGFMEDARQLFDKILDRKVFLWNVMIREYAKDGPWEEALKLYYEMQQAGIQPDKFTYHYLLKACAALSALQAGREIHDRIIRIGLESDVYVAVALINMYARCGNLEYARQVFDKTSVRDVVLWSAMIGGYAQSGYADEAMALFYQMQLAGVKPNAVTTVTALHACAQLEDLQQGKRIHDYVLCNGF